MTTAAGRQVVSGRLRSPSNHLVSKLTVVDNARDGISILDGALNTVQHNTIARNGGWGMSIHGGGRNTLVSNSLARNGSGGVLLQTGTRLNSTVENLVRKNDVIANQGSGIVVGGSLTAPFFVRDNRIEKNDVIANERDGIWLASGGGPVVRNRADRNGDDGIDADCRYRSDAPQECIPEIALTRNTANQNGDLGIEADAGVSDGGRNTARDNGNPAQCVGVACS